MRVLLLASHAIAEYDDVRMFADMGYDVFCPGGYQDPVHPGESLRPPLPGAPYHPELIALCEKQREGRGDAGPYIDWAKADLHPELVDWADVIIVHHFPDVWISQQWERIRRKRVVWRTCGQSNPALERFMAQFVREGLQVVRYSPREMVGFGQDFAGQDALIRFGKYPDDYGPWRGDIASVLNIAQHADTPHGRDDFLNWRFFEAATDDLPFDFAGPHTELLGGHGAISYDEMREMLRRHRVYLYTGTQPASYTLGLIEAMLAGIPVVSIGPERMWNPDLFEGHLLTREFSNRPDGANELLRFFLEDYDGARAVGASQRADAIRLFGIETVSAQWREFLS